MSEPFDPNIHLRPASDGLPMTTDMDPPTGLTAALAQQRQAFSGLEDLPIDEPELEGQETLPVEEPPPPATAVTLPLEPAVGDDTAAMHARVALLEAEIAAMRAAPQYTEPAPTPTPVVPLTVSEEVYSRIADRWQANFTSIAEQRADESDQQFEQRRARSFAETIVASVYEDLLPTEAVQARFQPTAERVAQSVAQQTLSQDRQTTNLQQQQETLVAQAVTAARAKGYDVHLPGTPAHLASAESKLFWDDVAQKVNPALSGEQQVATALALMPPKTVAVPTTPAPTRPQPMGRAGAGPSPGPANEGQEYQPMDMRGMLAQHQQVRRIGAA
jgi:hypothetical protein